LNVGGCGWRRGKDVPTGCRIGGIVDEYVMFERWLERSMRGEKKDRPDSCVGGCRLWVSGQAAVLKLQK
jgi:hypothetical protein